MENLLLLLFFICLIIIYASNKKDISSSKSSQKTINNNKDVEEFNNIISEDDDISSNVIQSTEPELTAFVRNKAMLRNKLDKLHKAMLKSPKSLKMDDSIVQNYKLQLDEINKLENEQIISTNDYNKNIIDNLHNKLDSLEKIVGTGNNISSDIKGVQSLQDGLKLNINHLEHNKYQVQLNDGCLDIKSTNNYGINKCDKNKNTQQFDLQYINNDAFYNTTLENGLDKVQSDDNIQYPFYVLKSSNTDNCLQNNFGYLSLEPCVVRKGQRWKNLNESTKCVI